MLRGLGLCTLLTVAGYALAQIPFVRHSGISPLFFALVLGVVVGNLPFGRRGEGFQAGLHFATKWLLRTGIVLFGLSLTTQQILALGPGVILLDMIVVVTVLTLGYQLGTRWLKLDPETALLTSAGSAICGAAAVLATEATIRSRPAAASMAVATVVLFGSLAMVLYPVLYPLMGWNEPLYGVYIGATVHEVAQVVAAGGAVGTEALTNAVVVKLVRVMLLVPFLLIVGRWWLRRDKVGDGGQAQVGRLTIPWFAFGFLAMVGLNSVVVLPESVHQGLVLVGQLALTMAMAALGYETRLDRLRSLGVRPLLLALMLFGLLLAGGGVATWFVMA